MHWILQNNLYAEEGFAALTTALERMGCAYSIHKVVPFAGTLEPDANPPGAIVVMGSYALARHARDRGWTPGAWLDNLDFDIQRAHWGDAMFNGDAVVCRVADIAEQSAPFFIRPVLDTKSFTGQVMDWAELAAWRDRILALDADDGATITGDTLVMICARKTIYSETRTWIVDGRLVTASGYKLGSMPRYSPPELVEPRITEFAQAQATRWSPNAAYVLDVFDTPDGPKIGEINNLNSAGFYKADMNKLVGAIEALVGPS